MSRRPESLDADGSPVHVGDVVRVIGVPGLTGMAAAPRRQSLRVFQHLVGTYRRVEDIEPNGFLGLRFRIRKGPDAGLHWVGIEPELVRLRRKRGS